MIRLTNNNNVVLSLFQVRESLDLWSWLPVDNVQGKIEDKTEMTSAVADNISQSLDKIRSVTVVCEWITLSLGSCYYSGRQDKNCLFGF